MVETLVRILFVDESHDEYVLIHNFLTAAKLPAFTLDWEATYAAALQRMCGNAYDVCLIDYHLNERDGIQLMREARAGGCQSPMIMITGYGNHQIDVEAMQAGAADYLDKTDLKPVTLERSIRYVLERARSVVVRESEARYRDLFENTSDLIQSVDEQGRYEYVNPAWLATLGYSAAEVPNLSVSQVVHPDYLPMFRSLLERMMVRDVRARQYEMMLVAKDGREIRVEGSLHRSTGRTVQGIFRDMTEWKRAAGTLAIYRQAIEASPFSVLIADARQPDLPLIYVNPAFERMTGYASQEAIGRNCRFLQGNDRNQLGVEVLRAAIKEGKGCTVTLRNYRKNGELFWNRLNLAPVLDADGSVTHFVGISEDVTERVQVDEQLRRYTKAIEDLYHKAPCGYHSLNEEGVIVRMNDTELDWLGYSREALIGKKKLTELLTPHSQAIFRETFSAFLERGWVRDVEYEMVRRDGTVINVLLNATAEKDATGNFIMSRASVFDITERKQAEAQIRHQRNYLAALHETTLGMMTRFELNDLLKDMVERAARLLGAEHGFLFLLKEDDVELMESVVALGDFGVGTRLVAGVGLAGKVWQSGQPLWLDKADSELEDPLGGLDKTLGALAAAPLKSGGDVVGVIGLAYSEQARVFKDHEIDILSRFANLAAIAIDNARLYTVVEDELRERLRIEQVLDDERTLLRTLIDNVPDSIYVKDTRSQFVIGNSAAARSLGVASAEALIGKTDCDFHPPEMAVQYRAKERQVLETAQALLNYEELVIAPTGGEKWYLSTKVPLRSRTGQVVGLVGISRDITEQKRLQTAEREQRLLAEALRDTAAALNSTLHFEEILDRILSNVERVVAYDVASIALIEAGQSRVVRAKNRAEKDLGANLFHNERGVAETPTLHRMVVSGEPLIIPDVAAYPGWVPKPDRYPVGSYAGIPIRLEGKVIGFLHLDATSPHFFSTTMVDGLRAFSDQIALAIQNARLYEQAQELAVLNERQRLARELHDAVSQTLFAILVISQSLARVSQNLPEKVHEGLIELGTLSQRAHTEMRTLLLELRPKALTDAPLDDLLRQLVETYERQNAALISAEIDGRFVLPPDVQIAFYRIAQETLSNVAKHANASLVTLRLCRRGEQVELRIRDNGRGFDPQRTPADHHGVRILQERAESIGAMLTLTSQLGQGTEVVLCWSERLTRR